MRRISKSCPNCGAPLNSKGNARVCRCEYCDSEILAVEFAYAAVRAEEPEEQVIPGADFLVEGTVLVEYVGQDDEVVVPEGVTEIGPQAFRGADVEQVFLPSSLEKISRSAFEECRYLSSVDVPEGVTLIGAEAFSGCESLESVRLPGSLKRIEDSAFENCSSLDWVDIPEGVEWIGSGAFSWCSSLERISLPSTIDLFSIDDSFCYCDSLETVNSFINFREHDDDDIASAFADTPFLERIRRRLRRCIWCGEKAERGSETCEFC